MWNVKVARQLIAWNKYKVSWSARLHALLRETEKNPDSSRSRTHDPWDTCPQLYVRATDIEWQHNSRQRMDKVKWTWGITLQERQAMDQVLKTWDNNIQQQQTADGPSEMDMGHDITSKTAHGWNATDIGQQQTVTVDSWSTEWNGHGASHYKRDSQWTKCHKHGTTSYSNSRQLMDRVKWTWGIIFQERAPMDQVPQTRDNDIQ